MIFGQQWRAALYKRLSKDDPEAEESVSIQTQGILGNQWATEHKISIVKEYTDDGWSGTNFDRPGFQEMMEDIKSGRINMVIVKDLSRFGRNPAQTGYYIEELYEELGVRFVAFEDQVDTLQSFDIDQAIDSNMMMQVKNLFNGIYPKETSRKTRAAKNAKAKAGQYLASRPPLGYVKSDEDKHKLVIDPEGAEIVRLIFQLASEGKGVNAIARILREKEIPNPHTYFIRKNPGYYKKNRWPETCVWGTESVRCILKNPMYIGNLAYGRKRVKKISTQKMVIRPEEEWIIAENTHEAIVSKEIWDMAQQTLQTRKRSTYNGEPNLFAGLLFCQDCGTAMQFWKKDTGKGEMNGEYNCGQYKKLGKKYCPSHYITYEKLYAIVLERIQNLVRQVSKYEQQYVNELAEMNRKQAITKTAKIQSAIEQAKARRNQIDSILKGLYEDKYDGQISSERFIILYQGYESEYDKLGKDIEKYERSLQADQEKESQLQAYMQTVKKYVCIQKLDATVLNALIDRIEIGRIITDANGKNTREVQIYFKVSGIEEATRRDIQISGTIAETISA